MAFVICKDNTGYAVSLERHKVYKTVRDAHASRHGLLRVIDESGEGYLYPATMFAKIAVPQAIGRADLWLRAATTVGSRTMPKSGTMPRKRSRKKRQGSKSKKAVA